MLVVDSFRMIILIIITLLEVIYVLHEVKNWIQRMYYLFGLLGIIIYSGISTLYIDFCDNYYIPYIIFQTLFTIMFVFAIKSKLIIGRDKGAKILINNEPYYYEPEYSTTEDYVTNTFLIICVILTFSYYFVQLVYPEMRISDLWNISLSLRGIFERRAEQRDNAIYQIFYYLNMAGMPFTYIYCYRKLKEGKWYVSVILLVLLYYVQIATLGYMSRNELLANIVFYIIIITNRKNNEIKITPKLIIVCLIIVVAMIPFLKTYEMLRLGVNATNQSLSDSFYELVQSETVYGQYYDFCADNFKPVLIAKYLTWMVTLPLPSAVFGFIKNWGLQVNSYFTNLYTGVSVTSSGYSIILPSIFGESLLIFGNGLFWIHAMFLGFFFGRFCTMMQKNKELALYNLYFAVSLFKLGRGGTGGIISNCINYMVMYLIVMLIIKNVSLGGARNRYSRITPGKVND